MPRLPGSSQAVLMQYTSRTDSLNTTLSNGGGTGSGGGGGGGILGANTSIASDRSYQSKESYGQLLRTTSFSSASNNHNNDSTRSVRSSEPPPPPVKKAPPKTNSIQGSFSLQQTGFPRVSSDGFAPGRYTMERSPESIPRRPARRRGYRAAESGKGDVLPSYTNTPNRARTHSLSNLMQSPFKSHNEPHHTVSHSLRSRRRTVVAVSTTSDDDEGSYPVERPSPLNQHAYQRNSWSDSNDGFSHTKGGDHNRPRQRSFYSLLPGTDQRWMNMKSPNFIALVLLFCVACFTAGSYHKVFAASTQLDALQREESLLLVHLHKIEEQLVQLHENLRRLTDRSEGSVSVTGGGPQRLSLDSDLLDVQMRKLREMEAELDHEVRSLQSKLSDSAKRSIVNSFGEGAVQVDLDISFGPENDNALVSNTLTIRLWHDTPHTAWTFLQQIENGSWNGAKFSVFQGRALLVQTENGDGVVEPQVDFIEHSQKGHDRYTVGLNENGIILNIQDNRDYFKKEASVGVITAGFDTLRQLVTEVEGQHSETATIRRASVSHLRKEQNPR